MAKVNGEDGFTQFSKVNVLDKLLVNGTAVGIARDVDFTATADNDDLQRVTINAEGFTSVSETQVLYNTGAYATGDTVAVNNITIDCSSATGGVPTGMVVTGIEPENCDAVVALVSNVGIGPLTQLLAVTHTQTIADVNAVDELTDLTTDGPLVPVFVADNDTVTIGADGFFDSIEVNLSNGASTGISPTYEYSTGIGTWATIPSIAESTVEFQQSGTIYWGSTSLVGWAAGDVGGNYLIRITRTANPAGAGDAVADTIRTISSSTSSWDELGTLNIQRVVINGLKLGAGVAPTGLLANELWGDTVDNTIKFTTVPT